MEKLINVPENTITGKDLDYLSDMFQWNYVAYKKAINSLEYVNSQEIIDVIDEAAVLFDDNINVVLDIIANPGGELDG